MTSLAMLLYASSSSSPYVDHDAFMYHALQVSYNARTGRP